jgi:non-ribosomal peptide synthase protein (TIGR01720 family)
MRAAYFDLSENDGRLLLIIHHLAVDGVSWRILLEDIEIAYLQMERGQPARLPAKTTSFKKWAEALVKYAQSQELAGDSIYWISQERSRCQPLPRDYPDGLNTSDSRQVVMANLDEEQTRALLQEIPKKYHTQVDDALLMALVESYSQWTGSRALLVDLEGHGREDIIREADVSRTVGWFTTVYPALLRRDQHFQIQYRLQSIKDQLRAIPRRGIGYGLLRYLSEDNDLAAKFKQLPQAEIIFNYLGQLDKVLDGETLFAPTGGSAGLGQSLSGMRSHVLEIDSSVRDGRLYLFCVFSQNLHKPMTIQRLADGFINSLKSLVEECHSTREYQPAPSRIITGNVTEDELSDLLSNLNLNPEE